MTDRVSGFVSGDVVHVEGAADGPLKGLRFAAKDIFDVAGHVTGGGNPDWARTHGPAAETAPAVQRLLDAGATLAGKTITDELTRGIFGINAHFGTPVNPRAPDRVPGGSSSGSASVVAAERSQALQIPRPAFEAVMMSDFRIAKTVYHNLLLLLTARLRKSLKV